MAICEELAEHERFKAQLAGIGTAKEQGLLDDTAYCGAITAVVKESLLACQRIAAEKRRRDELNAKIQPESLGSRIRSKVAALIGR